MAAAEQEILAGLARGAALASAVLLVGVVSFAALVWSPACRQAGAGRDSARTFVGWAWALFGVLLVSGLAEVSLYATVASGEAFTPDLLRRALSETRVGGVWLLRTGSAFLVALAATCAGLRREAIWPAAAALGGLPLLTLTRLSHAAAEGRFLPFFADLLHAFAGAAWAGGLLGFAVLLLGPLGKVPPDERAGLLKTSVSRFSRVATASVAVLAVTGGYAGLIHLTDPSDLVLTPYGRALALKLSLVVPLLAVGAANSLNRGRSPFDRLVPLEMTLACGVFLATGYLTSLTPP